MVSFSTILLGLSAIAVSFAAPAADPLPPHVERRGPHDFVLGPDHPLMVLRRNASLEARGVPLEERTNYVQNYKTGGTVNFTPNGNGFSLNFNTYNDFVVGVGWNPGSTLYDLPPLHVCSSELILPQSHYPQRFFQRNPWSRYIVRLRLDHQPTRRVLRD